MKHLYIGANGNIYSKQYDKEFVLVATCNANVYNSKGRFVNIMGGGNARAMVEYGMYSHGVFLDEVLGNMLVKLNQHKGTKGFVSKDYFLLTAKVNDVDVMFLQTKRHVRNQSPLDLVKKSIHELAKYAQENPDKKIAVPPMGTGLGGLKESDVFPCMEQYLPDNVYLIHREDK